MRRHNSENLCANFRIFYWKKHIVHLFAGNTHMDKKMSYILILGAGSGIAKALGYIFAKNGYNIYLAGRNSEELSSYAGKLEEEFQIKADVLLFDALDFSSHRAFYSNLKEKPFGIVCTFGYLGDQKKAQEDFFETLKIINTNYTGCVSILDIIANDLEQRRQGFIIGISSVAGDRGRRSNYIYGSAKAGFTAYLSGLRSRLFKSNVQVLTVKPGFIATKMTEKLNLPEKLTINPDVAANDIFTALQKKKDVIYTKHIWKYIMFIIKYIPERVFKRLAL